MYIVWLSKVACGEDTEIQTDCTIKDEKNRLDYNLSDLTLYDNNYEIDLNNQGSKIILNICHSIIFQRGTICHRASGVCLQESEQNSKFRLVEIICLVIDFK